MLKDFLIAAKNRMIDYLYLVHRDLKLIGILAKRRMASLAIPSLYTVFRLLTYVHYACMWSVFSCTCRDKVECGLHFLGLIIMENKLKRQTRPVIRTLRAANIRSVMVTGELFCFSDRIALAQDTHSQVWSNVYINPILLRMANTQRSWQFWVR